MVILGVALAGGIGALIRWLVSARMAGRAPVGTGTALVNLAGAFALGAVAAASHHGRIDPQVFTVLGTGLLGALTTFSTWMVETLEGSGGRTAAVWRRILTPTAAGVFLAWVGSQAAGGL